MVSQKEMKSSGSFKKKKEYNFLEVILNIFIFGFFGSVVIVLTRFFQSYLQELPFLFQLFYIIGVLYFMILFLSINWASKINWRG